MRPKYLVTILVLLALAVLASPAHAGGIVSICDEAHLLAALAGGGTVTFSCSGTITLTARLRISADTTIDGSGQDVTISGNNAVRVFNVNSGVTLNLDELTVANGKSDDNGGGIYNSGTLNASNSAFSGNSATGNGGAIYCWGGTVTVSNSTFSGNSAGQHGAGGGIVNVSGTVTVSNSTFSGNNANDLGGGIANAGTLTVSNSTFSGNNSDDYGGGIYNQGTLTVSNSTFSGNSAYAGGAILGYYGTVTVSNSTFSGNSAGTGGGINQNTNGTATLENTIVANSTAGGNCSGAITDGGGNLSYPDTTCPGINSDPLLGPLQNNVGPTDTMRLGPGSAAIDAGNDAICATAPVNNRDQRGIARPWGTHCDIGAVEQVPLKKMWLPTVRSQ